jgi:DNA-binding IclR family transcriptional regulator
MTMASDQPFTDQVSLMGKEADVYEAIATLEYLGRPVKTSDIVSATGLDEATVRQALRSLTQRGVLVETTEADDRDYEPAYRGWSTAPEQAAGPRR